MAGRTVRLGCPHRTVAEEDGAHAPALILVLPWRYHSLLVRHPGADRDFIASVLSAGSQRGFRERPVHHDPGRVWLADSVGPLLVSELDDLYRVRTHVQCPVPQGVPQAS